MKPFEKISAARRATGMSSTQKLILLTVATHLGENDFAFLSFTTLQAECCLARSNVSKNLSKLIDLGVMLRKPPSDGYRSNRYGITFERLASSAAILVAEQNQASSASIHRQYQNKTSLVAEQHSKGNINNSEKKIKNNGTSKAGSSPDRKTSFPENMSMNHAHRALAKELGLDVENEFLKFKEWHLAKGNKFFRWDMALNKWLRKAAEFAQGKVKPAITDFMEGVGRE